MGVLRLSMKFFICLSILENLGIGFSQGMKLKDGITPYIGVLEKNKAQVDISIEDVKNTNITKYETTDQKKPSKEVYIFPIAIKAGHYDQMGKNDGSSNFFKGSFTQTRQHVIDKDRDLAIVKPGIQQMTQNYEKIVEQVAQKILTEASHRFQKLSGGHPTYTYTYHYNGNDHVADSDDSYETFEPDFRYETYAQPCS